MQVEFGATQLDLELFRAGIDREIFYSELHKWDYGGLKEFDQETSKKSFKALIGMK